MKKMFSFRLKITVMLIIVVVSISFISFYLYNGYLTKKINRNAEENIVSVLHLLVNEYYHTKHDEQSTLSLLNRMEKHTWVLKTYFANSKGKVLHPVEHNSHVDDVLNRDKLFSLNKKVTLESYNLDTKPYTRVFLKIQNAPDCHECHAPAIKTLGYMVYDISIIEPEKSKTSTLLFSLFFTIFMVLIIVSVVMIMHYKFVKKSLAHFQSKIEIINKGNLNERIIIPESKELGQLGINFNEMLENFQKTQNELLVYHKKELKNNKKLATVGEMAARLAHEIRNPITGIANAIEIIVNEMHDEQNKPILEEIQRQANRVNDAVSNLLIYSRSKDLNVQVQDINELVKSLVLFLKSQNHNNKIISFHLKLQADIPVFNFDHEKIENALLNLGLNAIQSINDMGTVTFRTNYNPLENVVTITIEDTGIGISKNLLSKIFSPFYTTRTEGTGLGLAIVKDIVEKHRGKIWVEQNIDGGSIFNISLPIEKEQNFI